MYRMAVSTYEHAIGALSKESAFPALDGIRAISCILVCCSHGAQFGMGLLQHYKVLHNQWWPIAVACNGDVGVDFFLLLSGFLIGLAVIEEVSQNESFNMVGFLIRRAFRIVPVFYLVLLMSATSYGFAACREKFLFIDNFFPSSPYSCPSALQTWTVSLEMQLYIITPPTIMLCNRASKACQVPLSRFVMAVCACFGLSCCLARLSWAWYLPATNYWAWYTPTQNRCAPYFSGVAVSALLSEQSTSNQGKKGIGRLVHVVLASWACFVLIVCMYFGGDGPFNPSQIPMSKWPFSLEIARLYFVVGRPLIAFASAYLLCRIILGFAPQLHSVLAAPIWRPFARLSYSAYLMQTIHIEIVGRLGEYLRSPHMSVARVSIASLAPATTVFLVYVFVILFIMLAFALAILVYILLEYPCMRLGRRAALVVIPGGAKHCRSSSAMPAMEQTGNEFLRPLV